MFMVFAGWTFAFDGRSLTVSRRGTPWRRRRVEHLPLGRLRTCYLLHSESHGLESHDFWLLYDTGVVHIGISREFYQFGDAYWFAKYLNEAICERLRWIFENTIGLGPHPKAELFDAVQPVWQLPPYASTVGDVPRRLEALRKEGPLSLGRRTMTGPTRPSDLQTNHDRVLEHDPPCFDRWWTFVDHIRADYEPTDDPAWEEVVRDLMGGRRMMTESGWRQYNRSGYRNPRA